LNKKLFVTFLLSLNEHSIINTAKKRKEEDQSSQPLLERNVNMSDKLTKNSSNRTIFDQICYLISIGRMLHAACVQIKLETGQKYATTKTQYFRSGKVAASPLVTISRSHGNSKILDHQEMILVPVMLVLSAK
jgi:hypothetical protein